MSSKQVDDLEMIISNYVRNHYENKYNKQHVPMAVKYVIVTFSKKIIASNLLSVQQDLDFLQLLKTKLPNIAKLNLLFRASEHSFKGNKFHSLCDNKGPTVTIIKSNHGNIFGGYVSKSWTLKDKYVRCENAFLFLIKSNMDKFDKKCPLLFDMKDDKVVKMFSTTWNIAHCGPIFGNGNDIYIDPTYKNYTNKFGFDYGDFDGYLCGAPSNGLNYFDVIDYEVFQLQ